MGRVKEFAFWLASCVYERGMSDDGIVDMLRYQRDEFREDVDASWIRLQISHIRNQPEVYRHEPDDS